jgi:hypothetical protein
MMIAKMGQDGADRGQSEVCYGMLTLVLMWILAFISNSSRSC